MNRNSVLSKIRYTYIESEFSKKIKLAILLPVHWLYINLHTVSD